MNHDEIVRLDRRHVWHPCTQEKDHESLPPIPIERGEGCYLITTRGERIIDAVSSWWVNLFGHNHPRLNRALQEQTQRIAHHIFAGFTHEPAVELARRLCDKAPGNLSKVFFADNGSAAVEVALKMSFQYWQQSGKTRKTRFVSISEAYHGETLGALAVSGCDLYRSTYRPILMQGFSVPGPDCFRCPYGLERETCQAPCFAAMEDTVAAHHEEIAGIIIEPLIQAAAGMRIYSPVYLQKLRALCDHYQVHYIADEIAVGFGRTGRFFANEHAGTAPDILCLSKGITGGYLPLAVTLTSEEIYRAFYDDYETLKAFLHSHSYTGNPLACALAVEVMKIFEEEDILGQLQPRMRLLDDARSRFAAHAHVGEVRRLGLVAAIEMVKDKKTREGFPWQQRRGYQFYRKALERGALLRPLGNVIYFMPPLNIPMDALEKVIEVAWDCLNEVCP
ncbi:adenosylmethionine--8-amino-7-oxononanoate transaminase [Geoalkalibacter halelectricus]|uniref:Adenosylmethionine-8-amino-7-oxononanoate aminotransferase n=1 Tax=Geoalkalibacter halelectricus TaxID=2847045 RepID=A0ABY5ZNW9_9BACT|nr:adenosylmethionine--8-amino-7-oxononanoate transaminase [Geoalkalibacter halelectricus]MDO3379929.1 adenosylmethionine--8-amino-7-oxononanoate transaminase [Geoalkalibacter halelectricus]UWZ80544.1 adenosylmethionine--8-amino-7-oxononanoate transaminase [Geoalkalibacter halelectricus]